MSDTKTIQRMKQTENSPDDAKEWAENGYPTGPRLEIPGHPQAVPIMDGEDFYFHLATGLAKDAMGTCRQLLKQRDALKEQVEKANNDLLATRLAVRQIADRMSNGHPGWYFETWCSQLRDIADGKI